MSQTLCAAGKWPSNMRAAVSLTYDDGYIDNIDVAAPTLETYGYRGTFYLTKNMVDQQAAISGRNLNVEWQRLHLKGHEIGSHGVYHTCLSVTGSYNDINSIPIEVSSSKDWLNKTIAYDPFRSYAYPCGETKAYDNNGILSETYYPNYVANNYYTARGSTRDINKPSQLKADRITLKSYVLTPANASVSYVESILSQAATNREWVIFVFHSIGNGPYGISPELHEQIIQHIYIQGVYWVAPVRDVANYIQWFM